MIASMHARVLTTVTIYDHKGKEHTLDGAVEAGKGGTGEMADETGTPARTDDIHVV